MSRYYGGYNSDWAPYVPVAERRRQAATAMEKLRRKSHPVAPVVIEGRAIATTFWGKAWCANLESYRDHEYRLERGRTYVRNGSVVDLQIAPTEVTAMVSGSSVYQVKIDIGGVARRQWAAICKDCAGGIDSLVELLQGRFSKGVMERICRQDGGLFPKPKEIRFSCSCPDYASMCKHVAAALYGVAARLDERPELLFRLRAVDENELLASVDAALPTTRQAPVAGKVLEADDLSALFGLDMDANDSPTPPIKDVPSARQQRAGSQKPAHPAPSGSARKAVMRKSTGLPAQSQMGTRATAKRNGGKKTPAPTRSVPRTRSAAAKRGGRSGKSAVINV